MARPRALGSRPFAALTAVVSVGVAIFFALYSLVPVTRAESPQLGSLFVGTMMAFVMGVQVFTPALIRALSLRTVLAGSMGCLAVGALLAGTSASIVVLLIGGVVSGAGFGVLIVAGTQGVALLVPAKQLGRALGLYGLITMAATAVGAPASVQLALIFSPPVFGWGAMIAGVVAAGLTLGIPPAVGRGGHAVSEPVSEPTTEPAADPAAAGFGPQAFLRDTPWLVMGLLLLGVIVLSYGLTSLPVLATPYGSAALIIFLVQAGNAVGRWLGGELEPRLTAAGTVMTGATLIGLGVIAGLLLTGFLAGVVAGVCLGVGIGIIQTVTLHTAMLRMGSSRASVVWNLAVDGGLWAGGILWGIALAFGFTGVGALVVCAMILLVGMALVPQLRRQR